MFSNVLAKVPLDDMIDQLGTTREEILKHASKAMEAMAEAAEDKLKGIYDRLLILQALRNWREWHFFHQHPIINMDEFTVKNCQENCGGSFKIFDEAGYFWYTCQKQDLNYCKLSQENREKLEAGKRTIRAFSPFVTPEDYAKTIWDRVNQTAKNKIGKYMPMIAMNGVTLYGGIGTGKTSIFYLLIKELTKRNADIFFITVSQFFTAFIKEQEEPLKRILGSKYLFIDDIGTEYKSDYGSAQFESICCNRFAEGKITNFSTNLKIEEFQKAYPRTFDRQKASNMRINVPGESLRQAEGGPK